MLTIHDITALDGRVLADFAKSEVPEDCPNLIEWCKRMAEWSSVLAALWQ